jgi:hypothetical protein
MVVDKDDNLILADESFLRMYSKDGKSVKKCKLGGEAWIISLFCPSGDRRKMLFDVCPTT